MYFPLFFNTDKRKIQELYTIFSYKAKANNHLNKPLKSLA